MLACLTLVSLHFFSNLYSHVLIFKIVFTLVCLFFINPVPYGFDRDLLDQSTKFGTVTS